MWTEARERIFILALKMGKLSGPVHELTKERVLFGRQSACRRQALSYLSFKRCHSRPLDHIFK